MLESFLGDETFLAGLHLYLQQHQYSNAETSDLWSAMTEQVAVTSWNSHVGIYTFTNEVLLLGSVCGFICL